MNSLFLVIVLIILWFVGLGLIIAAFTKGENKYQWGWLPLLFSSFVFYKSFF